MIDRLHNIKLEHADEYGYGPNRNDIGWLIEELEISIIQNKKMREALEQIQKPTYGTEMCNSNGENNSILAPLIFQYQKIARECLTSLKESHD